MSIHRPAGAAVALLLASSAASGGPATCTAASPESAVVAEVIDGDTVVLDGGAVLRLAGIVAPKSEEGGALAEAARQALAALVRGKGVLLGNRDANADRHGRTAAQVFLREGGAWVEREILRRGLARVFTLRDSRSCGAALLAAENEGRAAGAGLWSSPDFAISEAGNPSLSERRGLYQIIEGRVLSVGRTASTVYLDFGRDWASDFTVTVRGSDEALFESEGLALDGLKGRRVRVRGWLAEWNGPTMNVDHPEQIEVLSQVGD